MTWGLSIRAAATALTTVAVAAVGLVATAAVANAEGGLAEKGKATFVVPADGKPITVTQTMTVTNQSPSTATKYFFWTGYPLWLPNGGTQVKATSNGSPISVKLTTDAGQKYADVTFPKRLQYGQTRTFTVTYTLPGAPPRSSTPGRVGTGFAAIDVYSPGDAGEATIEIVAPRSMDIDLGENYDETDRGTNRVATLRGGGSDGLWSMLSLRDPTKTLKQKVTVDTHRFDVVAFPGDTAWVAHVAKNLPGTVRELEKLTGQDWPTRSTSISEDFSRLVYGWDGTYRNGDITVSEAIDPALLAHELAHAWANPSKLDERWLTEGLAQELTTQVMAATKGKDDAHDRVTPTQKGAFPLAEWTGDADTATEAEDYGYPASWNAVHALVGGSNKGTHTELFRALTTNHTIYDVPGEGALVTSALGWEQAHDLFEVTGGNTKARSIMTAWVTGAKGVPQFTARDAARKAYAANDKLDGDWALPRGVRQAMARWNFPVARAGLTQTQALSTQAATAQAAAAKVGLDTKGVRTAYEKASDTPAYDTVAAQLRAFSSQAKTYGDLRTDVEDANPLASLGGLVLRPAADLDRAQTALAKGDTKAAGKALEGAESAAGNSTVAGGGLLVGIPALLAGLFFGLRALSRRRDRSRTRAHEVALAGTLAPGLQTSGLVGEVPVGEALEEQPPHDDTERSGLLDPQPRPGHTA